jgi:hypothetical protein
MIITPGKVVNLFINFVVPRKDGYLPRKIKCGYHFFNGAGTGCRRNDYQSTDCGSAAYIKIDPERIFREDLYLRLFPGLD